MSALAEVAGRLRCPTCGAGFSLDRRVLGCANGHRFDVARQGYVSLLGPRAAAGDTAEMVSARAAFLGAGHFAPIVAALGELDGLVVELGAGTGYYLAAALTDGIGIALDASKPALRRAARAHPRIVAVGCDIWREIPLQDAVADVVLDVFAPRNGPEIARALAPSGRAVIVTPTSDHLAELRGTLGLLDVDPLKSERLRASLRPLHPADHRLVEFTMTLSRDDARNLVAMGPSAHHVKDPDVARLPDPVEVTASVAIHRFFK